MVFIKKRIASVRKAITKAREYRTKLFPYVIRIIRSESLNKMADRIVGVINTMIGAMIKRRIVMIHKSLFFTKNNLKVPFIKVQ